MAAGYESPTDKAIREAMQRGAFDDLPGAGKPLAADPEGDDFLRRFAAAEEDGTPFLPRALQLRKEAHDLPARIAAMPAEAKVRALVTELAARIAEEIRTPTSPIAVGVRPPDVEEVLARWRADRAARIPPAAPPQPAPAKRRWWRRRSDSADASTAPRDHPA